jgi:hypothetical protein
LKWVLAIAVSTLFGPARSQDTTGLEQRSTIKGSFTQFEADKLGNLYVLTRENRLVKYGAAGDSMGVFNDVRRYGRLTSIDASNPLKTILFYRDFKTVVLLDRFLNLLNVIDLRKQNLFQVTLVAQSYDNRIWLYDEQESRLRKVGEDGRPDSETAELRLVLDEAPEPAFLQDRNGYVYMYDPVRGLYIFDYYGAMKSRLPFEGWEDVQVVGDYLLGRKQGLLMRHRLGTLQTDGMALPERLSRARALLATATGVYALDDEGVHQYGWPRLR